MVGIVWLDFPYITRACALVQSWPLCGWTYQAFDYLEELLYDNSYTLIAQESADSSEVRLAHKTTVQRVDVPI